MFRFAHISDLHLAPLPPITWRQLCGKRLIGYLNWRLNRKSALQSGAPDAVLRHINSQKPQHLVISGDLVNLALPQEFRNARQKLESLGSPRDISLVFGNHDAYVPGAFRAACAMFAPWIAGDSPAPPGAPFPYLRRRGNIAFIGVSSAVATPIFCAAGIFGAEQARALTQLLRQAKAENLFRAVIIHHPPLPRAAPAHKTLLGIKRFQNALAQEGAELVLHGHTHLPTLSYISGAKAAGQSGGQSSARAQTSAQIPVVGVASAAQEFGSHRPPAGYNLFSAERGKNGAWRCKLERYAVSNKANTISCFAEEELY